MCKKREKKHKEKNTRNVSIIEHTNPLAYVIFNTALNLD